MSPQPYQFILGANLSNGGEAHPNIIICWCVLMYAVAREICLDLFGQNPTMI